MSNRLCSCDNCDWQGAESMLSADTASTPDLAARLDAGGVVPAGECPVCGALAYYDDETTEAK